MLDTSLQKSLHGEATVPLHWFWKKDAQKHIRAALASAIPSRKPLLHDLEASHSRTLTAWQTILWHEGKGKSLLQLK